MHGLSRDGMPAIDLLSEASIAGAAATLALLRPEHSGGFYDYRGEALPW